jgi:hypothetical protein
VGGQIFAPSFGEDLQYVEDLERVSSR